MEDDTARGSLYAIYTIAIQHLISFNDGLIREPTIEVVLAVLGDISGHLLALATGQMNLEEAHWQLGSLNNRNDLV